MAHAVWDGGGELPSDDLGVLLSCGSGGGAEGVDGKVGVGGEELDEAGGGVSGGGGTGRRGWEGAYRWPTVPVAPRMPTLIWGRAGADMRVL